MSTPSSAARRTIAAGGNPSEQRTFTHPDHGELTFTFRLPLAVDSLRHSIEVDNLLQDLSPDSEPSFQTKVLAAAIAGMTVPAGAPAGKGLMLDVPAISRTQDPDDEQKVHVEYYDPASEPHAPWLGDVWIAFSNWRMGLLSDETVEAVGKSSAATSTSSAASSEPSAEPTAPRSTTPAS